MARQFTLPDYTGNALKFLRLNSTATGLEWANGGSGGGTINGTIATNQIGYGSALDTLASDANATRVGSGAFQTDLGSFTFAQGSDDTSNLSPNGLYQANTVGATGNAITLTFNGTTDTYASVLSAWNIAHPSNTATLIKGTGSDIPDAQTITFVGGGTTGYHSGTISAFGAQLQGSGLVTIDTTNSVTAFTGAVNLAGFSGSSELVSASIVNDGTNLGASLISAGSFQFFATDQSTYNSSIMGNSSGLTLKSGSKDFFIEPGTGLGWEDQNTGNRFLLPTGSTPSVGQVLGVASISGGDYTLGFQAGGGGTTYRDKEIVFGDGSTPGGITSGNLTFDTTGSIFETLGINAKLVVNGNSGGITAQVGNLNPFEIVNPSTQIMFIANNTGSGPNVAMGDISDAFNHTKLTVNDVSSIITGFGNKVVGAPVQSSVVFTGGGLDDLVVNSSSYNGITGENFSITVDGVNDTYFSIATLSGTLVAGDSVVDGTSGATGTVTYSDGVNVVLDSVIGTFTMGDSISGGSGFTGTVNSSGVLVDTATVTDGLTTLHNVPIGQFSVGLSSVVLSWSAITGHTLGNNWAFTMTPGVTSYGNMLSLDGANNLFKMGDIDTVGNGTLLTVDDGSQTIKGVGTGFYFGPNPSSNTYIYSNVTQTTIGDKFNVSNRPAFTVEGDNGDSYLVRFKNSYSDMKDWGRALWLEHGDTSSIVHLGDVNNTVNGTKIVIDDITQNITSTGTIVETSIGSTTYGGTLDYSAGFAGKARAYFNGSHSGSVTILLLPTGTIAPIGTKFTIDDLGLLAPTDNITIDAGTSNNIVGTTSAQTYVMTNAGQSITLVKLTSTDWKVE